MGLSSFLWCQPEQSLEQITELLRVLDVIPFNGDDNVMNSLKRFYFMKGCENLIFMCACPRWLYCCKTKSPIKVNLGYLVYSACYVMLNPPPTLLINLWQSYRPAQCDTRRHHWCDVLTYSSHSRQSTTVMTSSNGNIFRTTGHMCGEFTGDRWIPRTNKWRGALMFSLICAWINGWVNNREAGDLRRYGAHYVVTVMPLRTNTCTYIPVLNWPLAKVFLLCVFKFNNALSMSNRFLCDFCWNSI